MRTAQRSSLGLECLEPRETPATLVNPTTVAYQDVDGDNVTVQFSKPLLDAGNVGSVFTFDSAFATAGPQQLKAIDLTVLGQAARGIGVTHAAVRSPNGGDGLAAVGHVNSALVDLGTVVVDGDLGRIFAGDTDATSPGLAGLTVQSLGRFALTTGAPDLQSFVAGSVGALKVRGDIVQTSFVVLGGVVANVGSVSVGGSIFGSSVTAGFLALQVEGNIGPTVIKGDLVGGSQSPAVIIAGGKLASLTVGGSFLLGGGLSASAGAVGSVGPVTIRGSVVGAALPQTGSIISLQGGIASVSIGGSLIGGVGSQSGAILAKSNIGDVTIGRDLIGGGSQSGQVFTEGSLGRVKIGGSVVGGSLNGAGLVGAVGSMGEIRIGGDIRGGAGLGSGQIAAGENIAAVRLGGSLLGSTGTSSGNINASGSIGPVAVRGNVVGGTGQNSGLITAGTSLGSTTIGGSLTGGDGLNSGRVSAVKTIASLTIGASLTGGGGSTSGSISAGETLGPVSVSRDLIGSAGLSSGTISSGGAMPKLTIGGSVIGGSGNLSGQINPGGAAGKVKIGGDIVGGAGVGSGSIAASNVLAAVSVGGAVRGGSGSGSGAIVANAAIGSIAVAGDLVGGSASGAAELVGSGSIQAGRIGKLTLGGSLISGLDATAGIFKNNGAVISDNDIGTIQINGSILGNATHAALISARGSATPTATSDIAIGKLTVKGRVEFATILGGFDRAGNPVNGDAQIGAVSVGGDWVASSLATGAIAAGTGFFGGADVFKITGGGAKDEATLNSQIASVTIKGQAFGTLTGGDFFGIVAERVGLVSLGGVALPTAAGHGNDDFVVGSNIDFKVNEFLS